MADLQLCKREIFKDMLAALINSLFREYQDYHDCLERLQGQEIHASDRTYVLNQVAPGQWTMECFGEDTWIISFRVKSTIKYDGYDRKVSHVEVVRNNHLATAPLIGDLMNVTAHILCTYHPNGNPLKPAEGAL